MTRAVIPDIAARCITLVGQEWPRLMGRVEPDSGLAGFDLDSLDMMVLVLNAEQEFRVNIPDLIVAGIRTPRDLARAVQNALDTRQALS